MHVSLQCIIGDGEAVVVTVVRVPEMIQRIIDHNEKLEQVKLVITNFQKNDNMIITSERSSVELDNEVIEVH